MYGCGRADQKVDGASRKLREWTAAEDAARAWEAAARELERVLDEAAEELLDLQQAATTPGTARSILAGS